MDEVTLEYAEAYFHDRIKELKNQIPNGDPFVFIGAFAVLQTLANHSDRYMAELLPQKYAKKLDLETLETAYSQLGSRYSLIDTGIALTHVNKTHLKCVGDQVILAAEPFLNDIDIAITQLFTDAKTDELLRAKLYVSLNEAPIIR